MNCPGEGGALDKKQKRKRKQKQKLPRLFQLNVRLYFLLLSAFAIATFFLGSNNEVLAAAQFGIVVLLMIYSRFAAKKRTKKLLNYLESMTDGMDLTIRDMPLPAVVYNPNSGEIIWSNKRFSEAAGLRVPFFERSITEVVPEYNGDWLLDNKSECPTLITLGEGKYRVYGSVVRTEREYIATTYWVDVTAYEKVSEEYLDSRLIIAILVLDNYDELVKGMSEKEKSVILSNIDDRIVTWTGGKGGYLCRTNRDRYIFIFEERHLSSFTNGNFSILSEVHADVGTDGVYATLCIGIGKDGDTPHDNYRYASLGIEMALSRGGDQAVIRNRYGFEFFGGHSPHLEKRTKVRSRIMASAFGELLIDASKVFIMGHKASDFDSVGAAIGVACIARAKKKFARIVINQDSSLAQNVIETVEKLPEYFDVFITEQEAILEMDSKSLLVVVDTNRPEQVESESLLLSSTRIAVIDHHRRAADYISNAVLNFHEPHASSTAELVTELLQYLVDRTDILRVEAEALLAGLVLDTKGFSINTGSGTFDAAAYLRRAGADAISVKKLLQTDIEIATARYDLMRSAVMYREGVAIASGVKNYSRVEIAQAADELLNIKGVRTSFVIASDGDSVCVSGRSIGGLNVQVVLEKLGGGGSQSTAGLKVRGKSVEMVANELKKSIDECAR